MGKMFAKAPSDYLGITDPYLRTEVDLACFSAVMADDNKHYEQSHKKAGKQALDIDRVISQYKENIDGR